MKIKDELEKLKVDDVYSLMLFVLFKIRDIPEYSALSELSYVLDKNNLLKLCEYFGGLTITIPTIDELESLIYSLLIYQYVDIDGMEFDEAVSKIKFKVSVNKHIKEDYLKLKEVLNQYEFSVRK